jgi:hypothetical protein
LIAAIVFAAAGRATAGQDEIALGGTTRALRSASANALTGTDLVGIALGYARALGAPAPELSLWITADLSSGAATGTMFQSVTTELSAQAFTAGLRARYRLRPWLAASARAALGAQRASVALAGDGQPSADDHGWGSLAEVGAALELVANDRGTFGFGTRVAFGYVAAQGIALAPREARADDATPLAMTEFALGRLDLSGPSFTVSLIGQF